MKSDYVADCDSCCKTFRCKEARIHLPLCDPCIAKYFDHAESDLEDWLTEFTQSEAQIEDSKQEGEPILKKKGIIELFDRMSSYQVVVAARWMFVKNKVNRQRWHGIGEEKE